MTSEDLQKKLSVDRLAALSLAEATELIHAGSLRPSELVQGVLDRLPSGNGSLNCFGLVTEESAKGEAHALDQMIEAGLWLGPLHGIPLAVKDCFDTAAIPTTGGSKVDKDRFPEYDADAVRRLRKAGTVMVGKTNLHEWGFGAPSSLWGDVRNPWRNDRSAGASSSGSAAAVAAGLCLVALGTDSGGSVRIPAAFCGVFGLKPASGRISMRGVAPTWSTLDHVGILARRAADAAIVLGALTHESESSGTYAAGQDSPRTDLGGFRIGVPMTDPISEDVRDSLEEAVKVFEGLGCRVRTVVLPDLDDAAAVARVIFAVEAADSYRKYIWSDRTDVGKTQRAHLLAASAIPAIDYVRCQRVRDAMRTAMSLAFDGLDAVLLPTMPTAAWRTDATAIEVGGETWDVEKAATRFCALFNLTGHPAASFFGGLGTENLPVGLQIVSRTEETIVRLVSAYEEVTGYWRLLPVEPQMTT